MKIKLRLTIDLDVDLNETDPGEVHANLNDLAELAYGEGLFTRDTTAEIDEWSYAVTREPSPTIAERPEDLGSYARADESPIPAPDPQPTTAQITAVQILAQFKDMDVCETCLCDLDDSEFVTGGRVTDIVRAAGYDESGRVVVGQQNA